MWPMCSKGRTCRSLAWWCSATRSMMPACSAWPTKRTRWPALCPNSRNMPLNAVWLKLAILSYDIAQRDQGPVLQPRGAHRALQEYRLLLVHIVGCMNRNNCLMRRRVRGIR